MLCLFESPLTGGSEDFDAIDPGRIRAVHLPLDAEHDVLGDLVSLCRGVGFGIAPLLNGDRGHHLVAIPAHLLGNDDPMESTVIFLDEPKSIWRYGRRVVRQIKGRGV